MKKTILSLVIFVMSLFALTSCFEDVDTVEIVSLPKLEFYQNEAFTVDNLVNGLSLKVNNAVVSSDDVKNYASITGFDLSQNPGIYSATVSYTSTAASGTVTFMYTIKAAKETYGFADYQVVNEANVYYISTVNQFRNIVLNNKYPGYGQKETVFMLSNDLDFENTSPWLGYEDEISSYIFKGTFDGQNYTIKNLQSSIKQVVPKFSSSSNAGICLFACCYDCTFKNINLSNCAYNDPAAKGVGLLGLGYDGGEYKTGSEYNEAYLIIDNVNTDVTCKITGSGNVGGLIAMFRNNPKFLVQVKNCTLNSLVDGAGDGVGGVIGSVMRVKNEAINVTINGDTIGKYPGAIFGSAPTNYISVVNCKANGDLYSSTAFISVFGARGWDINEDYQIDNIFTNNSFSGKIYSTLTYTSESTRYEGFTEVVTEKVNSIELLSDGDMRSIKPVEGAVIYIAYYYCTSVTYPTGGSGGSYVLIKQGQASTFGSFRKVTTADIPTGFTNPRADSMNYIIKAYDADGKLIVIQTIKG